VLEVGVAIATKGGGNVHGLHDALTGSGGVGTVGGGVVVLEGAVIGDGVDKAGIIGGRVHGSVIAVGGIAHGYCSFIVERYFFLFLKKK
jgi:hypothetical protein